MSRAVVARLVLYDGALVEVQPCDRCGALAAAPIEHRKGCPTRRAAEEAMAELRRSIRFDFATMQPVSAVGVIRGVTS